VTKLTINSEENISREAKDIFRRELEEELNFTIVKGGMYIGNSCSRKFTSLSEYFHTLNKNNVLKDVNDYFT